MHDDAVLDAIRDRVVRAARERQTLTYDELLLTLDSEARARVGDDLATFLRAVSIREDDAGRGLLTALVVRADGLPGAGWFRLAAARGRAVDDDNRRLVWEREVQAVFDTWRAK